MRAASVSFRGSAQLHMLMHDRYRTMLRTVRTQAAQQLRRLPDPRSFGRRAPAPTSPEAQTPGLP
ncbi:hypothetical protein H490_0101625 [Leucobacter sp. UCD-THU]|uniref:hypothetical protein n=1 Tax=Leucobacter sp. UCD-THU TaxID=1292023 RepID=UPI000371C9D7|nr:hypothetical protein [Leucobacter sp. UCD-THU]EYT56665.1 hypothetical protein H490_0101625 [Leucobacter sp. UCD-THU]